MDNFEEALYNIDIFCKVLVEKMVGEDNGQNSNIVVEPIEKLLLRKNVVDERPEPDSLAKTMTPLPQLEETLIDIFDEDSYVKVLMQCRCKEHKVTVHTDVDGIKICKRECHTNAEGIEVCADKCQKLELSTEKLQVDNMISKCSNNAVFEVEIPKVKI